MNTNYRFHYDAYGDVPRGGVFVMCRTDAPICMKTDAGAVLLSTGLILDITDDESVIYHPHATFTLGEAP